MGTPGKENCNPIIILHMLIRKLKRWRAIKVDLCPPPPKQASALEHRDAYRMLAGPTS